MKRRIIKQGHNTLTITLPKTWTEKLNLNAGDEVDVDEQSGSLLVGGKQNGEPKSTIVDIRGFNVPMMWRFFQSAYREGYDEIKVIYDPKASCDSAYNFYTSQFEYPKMGEINPKKAPLEMVQELVDRFIGIEIIDHGEDFCIVREMGELTSKEFDNSLRRIFLLIMEVFDTVIEFIKNNRINDVQVCKKLHSMDMNIDRFIDYCCRINNKVNDSSFQKNKPIMFSTLFLLELLADEFKYLGAHLSRSKKKVDEILSFAERVRAHFELYYHLFYKFERELVIKFGENDYQIYNEHFKQKESSNKDAKSIKRHLMQISKFVFCLMELRIEMEY